MREIKFRAWDGNRMQPVLTFGLQEGYININKLSSPIDDVIVMQFTGLKDKNGTEIFEGDLLRVWENDEYIPNRDSGGGIIDYDCKKGFSQIGKVGYSSCSFDYSTMKTLSGKHVEIHAPIDWVDNFEVIGNIYEHSELVDQQSTMPKE